MGSSDYCFVVYGLLLRYQYLIKVELCPLLKCYEWFSVCHEMPPHQIASKWSFPFCHWFMVLIKDIDVIDTCSAVPSEHQNSISSSSIHAFRRSR